MRSSRTGSAGAASASPHQGTQRGNGSLSCNLGPGDATIAHTKDEYITRSDLTAGAAAFGRFLTGG